MSTAVATLDMMHELSGICRSQLAKVKPSLKGCVNAFPRQKLNGLGVAQSDWVEHLADIVYALEKYVMYDHTTGWIRSRCFEAIATRDFRSGDRTQLSQAKSAVGSALASLRQLNQQHTKLHVAVGKLLKDRKKVAVPENASIGDSMSHQPPSGQSACSQGTSRRESSTEQNSVLSEGPVADSALEEVDGEDWTIVAAWLRNNFEPAAQGILPDLAQTVAAFRNSHSEGTIGFVGDTLQYFVGIVRYDPSPQPSRKEVTNLAKIMDALWDPASAATINESRRRFAKLAERISGRMMQERDSTQIDAESRGEQSESTSDAQIEGWVWVLVKRLYAAFRSSESAPALSILRQYR